MEWSEVAMIVFSCVTANHLGLVSAIEGVIKHSLPIVNCGRCFSFWAVMAYGCLTDADLFRDHTKMIPVIAASFLSSYAAMWLQLFFAFIDKQYNRIYEQIYPTADTADAGALSAAGTVSVLPGEGSRDGGENAVS